MIHREWILQEHLVPLVHKVVAVPHIFTCHDRGGKKSEFQLIYEQKRGIRRGWPDTELCLNNGRTFRCELKARGKTVVVGSAQETIISRLSMLGHPTGQADSCVAWCEAAERRSVPLRANWRTLAQLADAHVEAEIREKEAKAAAAPIVIEPPEAPAAPLISPRPKSRRTPSKRQIARVFQAMKPQ